MFTKRLQGRLFVPLVLLLLVSALITGCSGGANPTPASPATAVPKPPPSVLLNVSPGPPVPVGKGVAIVLKVDPYEKLDWKWSVSGTSGGQLNSPRGENNVYTAGNKEGVDIVEVEAMTASGVTVKQTVALTIVAAPDTPPPTATIGIAPAPTPTPTMSPPSAPDVMLTNIQEGQEVPCSNIARGTYPLDLKDEIWPVVYVGGRYHPQDEGGRPAQKINGNWYQTVRFGVCDQPEKTVGQPFQLIIVTANPSADAEFEKYIKTGPASGWPGLIELPPGVTEHLRISVIRK